MINGLIIVCCLFFSLDARAEEMAPVLSHQSAVSGALEQWQNGMDAVGGQMDALIKQNDELTNAYNQDKAQEQKILILIEEQRQKIEALKVFLKERGNKTDQDLRVHELEEQLKIKRLQLNKLLLDYKTRRNEIERIQKSIDDKKMKVSAFELHLEDVAKSKQDLEPKKDGQLEQLQAELQKQIQEEARLEGQMSPAAEDNGTKELEALQHKVAQLQSQKAALLRKPLFGAGNGRSKVYIMQAKKEELEVKIRGFEKRIDALKSSSNQAGSWPAGRKEMVRAMAKSDVQNKKLMNEIKESKENIALLRTQIGVLEKRVLFSKK